MDNWKKGVLIACLYGFFKEFCPLSPFLTSYLSHSNVTHLTESNATEIDVFTEIYPIGTYTLLVGFLCTLLVSDIVVYKPVIIFGAGATVISWCMLGWGLELQLLQVSQFTDSLARATDVAFFSYIFAVSNAANYRRVAGLSKSAVLIGQCLSYFVGQLLLSFSSIEVRTLVFVSLGCVILSFLLSLLIPGARSSPHYHVPIVQRELLAPSGTQPPTDNFNPPYFPNHVGNHGNVQTGSILITATGRLYDPKSPAVIQQSSSLENSSVYVPSSSHMFSDIDTSSLGYAYSDANSDVSDVSHTEDNVTSVTGESRLSGYRDYCRTGVVMVWKDLSMTYQNKTILVWSLWLVAALCVDIHVRRYSEELWDSLSVSEQWSRNYMYSGAVQSLTALLGVVLCLMVAFVRMDWHRCEEFFIGVAMLFSSALLVAMSHSNIWSAYTLCIIFLAVFQMLSTVAMFQIAGQLTCQRFGLVFGLNSFLSSFIEVLFLAIVVNSSVLGASVKTQFVVYSGFLGLGGIVFFVKAIHSSVRSRENVCCCRQGTQEDRDILVEEPG